MELLTFNEVWKRLYYLHLDLGKLHVESYYLHLDPATNALHITHNQQREATCLGSIRDLTQEKDRRLKEWSLVELIEANVMMMDPNIHLSYLREVDGHASLVGLREPLWEQKKELEEALLIIKSKWYFVCGDQHRTKSAIERLLVKLTVEIEERRRLAVAMSMHHRLGRGCGLEKLPDCLLLACMSVMAI